LSPERVLVTGGAGFIGSHIVDALVAQGHTVSVVDNLLKGKRENLNPAAHFHQVDIRDVEALGRVFSAERPQAIIHQAALADVRGSLVDPTGYAVTNIVGTLNLLEAARAVGTVRKFLFASTGGAVYGDPAELPATEKCPVGPLDPYGASKLACEYYIATYHHNYGLDYCLLRYANVYGPRQDPEGEAGVVAIFTGRMLRGQPAVIYGDGKQVRDFVYVGDIARANLAALERGTGIYNIGTGVPTDINTIFRELAKITGYRHPEAHSAAKLGEVRTTYLDVSLAQRELGWAPTMTLSAGLAQTSGYFRERMGVG
jgi:UDP-glucose 4-epimerase